MAKLRLRKRLRNSLRAALLPTDFADAVRFPALPVIATAQPTPTVHMLWVGGALSQLEQLSTASFRANGYGVTLWSYGELHGVPDGITRRDAREVLAEKRVFRDAGGSLAAFSDLFRYAVLSLHGGLWADTDVICLLPAQDLLSRLPGPFLVSEQVADWRRRQVNNNLIHLPAPRGGDIIDLAAAVADRHDPARIGWGDCGPRLLTALTKLYPGLAPVVMEPAFANPVPFALCPQAFLEPGRVLPAGACFLHCYNEGWRRAGIDKNAPWAETSLLGQLRRRYLAP